MGLQKLWMGEAWFYLKQAEHDYLYSSLRESVKNC